MHAAFRTEPTPDLEVDHELETIGSLHVLNACAAAKRAARWCVASSTMLYGPRPDNPNFLTRSTRCAATRDAHNVREPRRGGVRCCATGARAIPTSRSRCCAPCWIDRARATETRVTRYFARRVVPTLLGYDPLLQFVHEEDCLAPSSSRCSTAAPGVFNVVGRGVLPLSTLLRRRASARCRCRRRSSTACLLSRRRRRRATRRRRSTTTSATSGSPTDERGWDAFGEPDYTTQEAWMSFVSSRRMRRYR